ncbi:hypothetical protein DMP23_15055 [Amycolatopsis sp. A1MSW2902]|uniref:hypothetical protein n=1 Tax=Amycolatopsis TaxID=1813 RepID=UPI00106FD0FF|nr:MULTISPECIES: hypothetical protein [Amycolatopsis]
MTAGPEPADSAKKSGPVIASLIDKEIDNARANASSLQVRGLAVISSSGTLVTLLFGLSALSTKAQNFVLPDAVKLPLYLAAALLVLAAAAGIFTNAPRRSDAIALKNLTPLIAEDRYWNAPSIYAEREVAKTRLTVLQNSRAINISTARTLLVAIVLEIAGVACVTWAVTSLVSA